VQRQGALFDPKHELAERSLGGPAVQDALVAKLTRHGLIETHPAGEFSIGGSSGVSAFGRRVLSYVEDRGWEATADDAEGRQP
jgi:hypothetical protein